jgi:4-amino-4-deoxy-L-arabinose transferase-like glycosyltransferase
MAVALKQAPEAVQEYSTFPRTVALAAVLLAAAALRCFRLGTTSLWLDETFRVSLARMNAHDFLRGVLHPYGANSVAYHLVLRFWLVLGSSETVLRSLSVIFGLATTVALFWLGAELFDQKTGCMAAALAAGNALLIRYSQEICAYTLATLLAVLSALYLFRALRTGRPANWLGYVLASVVMLYCHVLTILVVLAQAAPVFLLPRHNWSRRGVFSLAIIATAFAPLGWCIAFAPPRPSAWLGVPGLHELVGYVGDVGGPDGGLLGLLLMVSALAGLAYALRERFHLRSEGWRYLFLFSWALLPPALLFALSHWQPLFLARYVLGSIPGLLLLTAAVIRRFHHRWIQTLCLSVLLLLSLRSSVLYLQHRSYFQNTDDWRHATAYLVQQARDGDTIVFLYPYERFPFNYYRERFAPAEVPARVFPAGSDEAVLDNPYPSVDDAYAAATAAGSERVWLVTEYLPNSKLIQLQEALARRFQDPQAQHFGFIRVLLFTSPGPKNDASQPSVVK